MNSEKLALLVQNKDWPHNLTIMEQYEYDEEF